MMASACVNSAGVPPESFPPSYQSAYGWLNPNVSHYPKSDSVTDQATSTASLAELPRNSADRIDFEFRLDEAPVTMLAADELFSEGKLVPLDVTALRAPVNSLAGDILTSEPTAKSWVCDEGSGSDSFVLSPKAPRCTTRWRELLGLKRLQNAKKEPSSTASSMLVSSPRAFEPLLGTRTPSGKSFKNLLQRHLKSSIDPSLSHPLLRDGEPDTVSSSFSSRLSLSSSSSSGPEHEDLPRLSLDSEKPRNPPRVRISRSQPLPPEGHFPSKIGRTLARQPLDVHHAPPWGVSADSPRMNPSGRIIFEGLERSSSSPSSFNGVTIAKHRGMARSYSANVRFPSVLNVPVCYIRKPSKTVSVFGLGQIFSKPRKDKEGSSSSLTATMGRPANAAGGGKTMLQSEKKRDRLRARREHGGQ